MWTWGDGIYKYRSIFLFWSSNFISATKQLLEIENLYLFSNISPTLRFEEGVIEFGAKFTIQWCFYKDAIQDLMFKKFLYISLRFFFFYYVPWDDTKSNERLKRRILLLTFPKRIKEKLFCQTQFSLSQMVDFSDILHLPSAIIYVKLTLAKRKSIYLIWRPILDLNVSNISLMTHTTK